MAASLPYPLPVGYPFYHFGIEVQLIGTLEGIYFRNLLPQLLGVALRQAAHDDQAPT